jgi:hypothetical protein
MGDLTVIILAAMLIILCVVIIKINEKIDNYISRFRKLEKALMKNADSKVPADENTPSKPESDKIPAVAKPGDGYSGKKMIAKA